MKNPISFLQDAIKDERYILRGYDKPSEALAFEVLRAIDFAFCRELFPNFKSLDKAGRQAESIRRYSVNEALKKVLPQELRADTPKLFNSSKGTAEQADEFLFRMGCLTMAEKQLNLLRSGALEGKLDKRKVRGVPLLVLTVKDKTAYREQVGSQGLKWLSDRAWTEDQSKEDVLGGRYKEVLPYLIEFLRSSPSPQDVPFSDVGEYFRDYAVLYLRRMSFRDLLDDDDSFGGRRYSRFLSVLEVLSAMSQQRLCYSGLLNADNPRIGIRNFMTGAAPYEFLIEGIAKFLDGSTQEVSELLGHLTLSPENALDHLDHGTPAHAPAVRTSQQLVMLPMYGLEMNPFVFLWTELRRRYSKDWFDAANRREARWVAELKEQFPPPRWYCLDGVKIKREGLTVTDIDFVAFDKDSNSVILFQLKWQQPFVSDDKVRRNNASNLIEGSNRWIQDVLSWIEAVGIKGVKERLSIKNSIEVSIQLVVLGRYHAYFTAADDQDPSAIWCDWGNFLRLRMQEPNASAVEVIESLRGTMEKAVREVEPESFFLPLGKEVVLVVNPTKTPSGQ